MMLMLESTRNDRCEGTLPGIVRRFGDSKLGKSPWLSEVESERGEIASGIGPSKSHGNLLPNASESARTLLFERHSQAVYNHCFRRTASWSSAEDLASIVWSEVWRRRNDARLHSESILPWLLAVANNCLRSFQRSQRRHRKFLAKVRPVSANDFTEDAVGRLDDERRMTEVLSATLTAHRE
jgi:hypothetical protein